MGPQASKMSPRASKITQNHENLVTQNQENPRKKLQEMAWYPLCHVILAFTKSAALPI